MSKRAVGCKNLHYATIKEDGEYDIPKKIVGLQEISTTNNYAEYEFYSDDQVDESGKGLTSVELSLTIKGLDPEVEADLMGKSYDSTTGVITTSVNDVQAKVALLYEITTLNGESDYRVLYNCKLAKDEVNSTTKGESIESDDITLSGVAIAREDGVVERTVNGSVPGASTIIDNFFKKVYEPTDTAVLGRAVLGNAVLGKK